MVCPHQLKFCPRAMLGCLAQTETISSNYPDQPLVTQTEDFLDSVTFETMRACAVNHTNLVGTGGLGLGFRRTYGYTTWFNSEGVSRLRQVSAQLAPTNPPWLGRYSNVLGYRVAHVATSSPRIGAVASAPRRALAEPPLCATRGARWAAGASLIST